MDKAKERLDAGLRNLDHYKNRLPRWRYQLREKILPVVRWETPYVAQMQETFRTPALDTYFAVTANLGTHTFFMVVLPILFWCGYTRLARGMVHILASGVFFSGFFKDMLCLPRPLSPPLQRITMSGSAALEYGFPSTHSTNAVSVAVYTIFLLKYEEPNVTETMSTILQTCAYCYGLSIVLGRVYCGMHGFLDVICGSLLGAGLAAIQCLYGDTFDNYIQISGLKEVLIVILVIFVLVRVHPEPVDDCPCFDDSVAFAGTMIGIEFGNWHFARTSYSWSEPHPATVPFSLERMGWLVAVLRIVLGVMFIFAWRGTMKPALLRVLPPVFRVVEKLGLTLPRRFFKQASEYKKVPKQRHDDNVIPQMSEIPQMLTSFRRRRAVSIGPQSEADAYETMAYRERKRRDSLSGLRVRSPSNPEGSFSTQPGYFPDHLANGLSIQKTQLEAPKLNMPVDALPPATSPIAPNGSVTIVDASAPGFAAEQLDDKDLFSNLEKPRVRYDVEVVTKLIVYSGIAFIAVEAGPILFDLVGLGI